MKEDMINYWLLRSVSAWNAQLAYSAFEFAVVTFYDDRISERWLYEQMEAADRVNGI